MKYTIEINKINKKNNNILHFFSLILKIININNKNKAEPIEVYLTKRQKAHTIQRKGKDRKPSHESAPGRQGPGSPLKSGQPPGAKYPFPHGASPW